MRIRRFLAVTAVLAAVPAFAQSEPGEPERPKKERYEPVETHDFEKGIEFESELKKPVGLSITGRPGFEFPSMIEERVHFKRDLVKSIGVAVKKKATPE